MKKLNWLNSLILVALMVGSLTGCSIITMMDISAGQSVKKTIIDTETRKTQNIVKKDVQIDFYTTRDGLGVRLHYQPYYEVQSRSIVKYKSEGSSLATIGTLVQVACFVGVPIVAASRMPDNYEGSALDFAKPWEMALMIGAIGDLFLTQWVVQDFQPTKRRPWERSSATSLGTLKLIPNQPVTLSLPLFQYRETYHTNADGKITIPAIKLIDKIPNLEPVLRAKSIKVETSTNFEGREQQDSFITIPQFREGRRDPLFALFRDQAALRREKPADLATQLTFSDVGDFIPNNILDAGERQGKLKITIGNKGQGPGIDVQLHLSSDNPDILFSKTRALGKIEPNDEKTVVVPITTNLQASDGVANILVEAKERRGYDAQKQRHRIQVARLKQPRLTITGVEINDKTLGNAVGNGNGIPENNETIELNVFIKNGGSGDALGVKLELVSINRGLDVQVKSTNLDTIAPNQTERGILRFHIPRTFAAAALNYELRVTEIRGADSTEMADALPMETQLPILAYDISPPPGITNGSSAAFSITPRNDGKLTARSVSLNLSVRNATVKPNKVDLGVLEAGRPFPPQSFTVTLPRTFKANQLSLNIQLSQTGFDGLSQTETYPVRQIAPNLEITDSLVADTNRDGNIQQGEQVKFEVRVTNNGELSAENTQLKVSVADPRIRIEEPERSLGRLALNSTSNVERFAFTVPRAVDPGALLISVAVIHRDFPDVERTLEYKVHAVDVETTTVTPVRPREQPQTPTTVANKPPVILLETPITDGQTVYSPDLVLDATVSDDRALESVQVMLNDRHIYDSQTDRDASIQLKNSNRTLLPFKVPLTLREGKNSIVITARDNNQEQRNQFISLIYERKVVTLGLENPSDVDVDIPQGDAKNPDALALVIGIGKYRDVTAATFADRDAIAFREYLIQSFRYSADRIFLLTNERATYRDIERGLEKIANQLTPNRQSDVIVFYAGHGTFKMESGSATHYLVSYEGDPNYPDDGYPLDAFYQKLSRLEAKSVTVFVDACFSGTDRDAQPIIKDTRSLMLPEMELPKSPGPVLASSASNQISSSYESKRHGLFTYYLLKGLRGEADGADGSKRNGAITLSELEAYTKKHVTQTAKVELGRSQEPTLTGSRKGEILLKLP